MDSNNNVVSNSSNVNDMLQSDPIPPSNLLASREKSNFPEIPKLKLSKPSSPNKRYYSLLKDKRNAVQAKRNSQPDSSVLLGSPDEKKSLAAQSPNSKPYKHKSLSISSVQKDEVIAHDLSELDLQNMHTYSKFQLII